MGLFLSIFKKLSKTKNNHTGKYPIIDVKTLPLSEKLALYMDKSTICLLVLVFI